MREGLAKRRSGNAISCTATCCCAAKGWGCKPCLFRCPTCCVWQEQRAHSLSMETCEGNEAPWQAARGSWQQAKHRGPCVFPQTKRGHAC
eukprot:1147927-Pelagomonas_calceolata.AAC.2